MSHCSRGGVREKGLCCRRMQASLASPGAFMPVMKAFPELRVCLAHFGGDQEWKDYLGPQHKQPLARDESCCEENWLAQILAIAQSLTQTSLKHNNGLRCVGLGVGCGR